jgi:hypothetical protein
LLPFDAARPDSPFFVIPTAYKLPTTLVNGQPSEGPLRRNVPEKMLGQRQDLEHAIDGGNPSCTKRVAIVALSALA